MLCVCVFARAMCMQFKYHRSSIVKCKIQKLFWSLFMLLWYSRPNDLKRALAVCTFDDSVSVNACGCSKAHTHIQIESFGRLQTHSVHIVWQERCSNRVQNIHTPYIQSDWANATKSVRNSRKTFVRSVYPGEWVSMGVVEGSRSMQITLFILWISCVFPFNGR